jgi:riboflavin kinase
MDPQNFDWSELYEGKERLFDKGIYLGATVVHGQKRGSKELGIPTANLGMDELGKVGDSLETGIFFGWARLNGTYYQTVVSVGWNPFYQNTVKTIEAHLLHSLDDFYGEYLELLLIGYLRPEANFKSLGLWFFPSLPTTHSRSDELISCIHSDIIKAKDYLEKSVALRDDPSNWTSASSEDVQQQEN